MDLMHQNDADARLNFGCKAKVSNQEQ